MSKKIISLALTLIMSLGLFCLSTTALEASELGTSAAPTASTMLVNGANVAFDAYNINGNNYFKLRDLAYTLNGTAKQFNVGWDAANNAITLTSGQGYAAVGGEMSGKGGGAKTAVPTNSKIIKDGNTVSFTAYNIDGNNYFKLRDIGEAFDFGVDWDGAKNTIVIDTSKGYSADAHTPVTTEPTKSTESIDSKIIGHWRFRSIQGGGTWYRYHDYTFNADGTFLYAYTSDSRSNQITYTEGKYTTSNGKVNMTEVIYERGESYESRYDDRIHEYEFGTNVYGVCLKIGNINLTDEAGKYVDMSLAVEFNKYSDIYGKDGTGTTEPTKPTDPPSGQIDNKIVGGWSYSIGTDLYTYQFSSGGTFKMDLVSHLTSVNGTFYTSNGTVYLKNLVFEYRDTTRQLNNQESAYSFGSDEYGEYLMIKTFKTSDTVSESSPIHKFRRQ